MVHSSACTVLVLNSSGTDRTLVNRVGDVGVDRRTSGRRRRLGRRGRRFGVCTEREVDPVLAGPWFVRYLVHGAVKEIATAAGGADMVKEQCAFEVTFFGLWGCEVGVGWVCRVHGCLPWRPFGAALRHEIQTAAQLASVTPGCLDRLSGTPLQTGRHKIGRSIPKKAVQKPTKDRSTNRAYVHLQIDVKVT